MNEPPPGANQRRVHRKHVAIAIVAVVLVLFVASLRTTAYTYGLIDGCYFGETGTEPTSQARHWDYGLAKFVWGGRYEDGFTLGSYEGQSPQGCG